MSDSWLAQKSNVKNIFNDFRLAKPAYTALAPVPLVQLSEAQMCCAALWESAATFLVREYKIKSGVHKGALLKFTNVLNYLRSAMRICEDVCKHQTARRQAGLLELFGQRLAVGGGAVVQGANGDVAIPSEASCR